VLEGCGTVLLNTEVSNPGEPIASQRYEQQIFVGMEEVREQEDHAGEDRSYDMQTTIDDVRMLAEVERVEFLEVGVLLGVLCHMVIL